MPEGAARSGMTTFLLARLTEDNGVFEETGSGEVAGVCADRVVFRFRNVCQGEWAQLDDAPMEAVSPLNPPPSPPRKNGCFLQTENRRAPERILSGDLFCVRRCDPVGRFVFYRHFICRRVQQIRSLPV